MKSAFWRATALMVAVGLMVPAAAMAGMAGEVSHAAMGGTTLIPTSAQLNTWTHLATGYGNYTEVDTGDLPSGGSEGQASLIWDYDGDNTLLFRVRQYDLGSQNSNFMWGGTLDSPFFRAADLAGSVTSNNAYDMGQMFNVALARELAGGGAFSVGGVYASHGDKDDLTGVESEDTSTAFGGQATWGNGEGLHLAASFFSESSTFNAGGGASDVEGDLTNFDLYGRYDRSDWVYQGGLVMATGSIDQDDVSAMGFIGNVGRFLKNDSDGAVAVEFIASYFTSKFEPDGGGEDKQTDLMIPGMRAACTQKVTDHFGLMLGANAMYTFTKFEANDGTNDTDDSSTKGMDFYWDGGVYYENGGLRVSGLLEQSNLGYTFSIGNEAPLVARVEATYTF